MLRRALFGDGPSSHCVLQSDTKWEGARENARLLVRGWLMQGGTTVRGRSFAHAQEDRNKASNNSYKILRSRSRMTFFPSLTLRKTEIRPRTILMRRRMLRRALFGDGPSAVNGLEEDRNYERMT